MPTILISACLLGIHCRYDHGHALCQGLVDYVAGRPFVPFCPEQLGGLPTPRASSEIVGGEGHDVLSGRARVVNMEGRDVTDAFKRGAHEALRLAELSRACLAIMKSRSPSCGIRTPYCETSQGQGMGVTAALFQVHGIRIFELGSGDPFPTTKFRMLVGEEAFQKREGHPGQASPAQGESAKGGKH